MGGIDATHIGKLLFIASSDAPGGFSSPDLRLSLQDAAGSVNEVFSVIHTGRVGIGNTNPSKILDVGGTASGVVFPRLNTTQQNALTAVLGEVIFNTDTAKYRFWDGSAWQTFSQGGGGGSSYTFTRSIVNTSGTVTLVNDTATLPGNYKYATNIAGRRGWYADTVPSLETVLAYSLYSFQANHAIDLGVSTLTFNKGSHIGASFGYGVYNFFAPANQGIRLTDTTGGNAFYSTWYIGSAVARFGGNVDNFTFEKPIVTADNSSYSGNFGLNSGTIRAVHTNPNNLTTPFVFWSNSATGHSFDILAAATGNNALVIDNPGKVGLNNVSSPTAFLHIGPSTTGSAHLRLETSAGANPSSPNSGDLWWNGTNLNFRTASTTVDLLAGGSTPSLQSVLTAGPDISSNTTTAFGSTSWTLNQNSTGRFKLNNLKQDGIQFLTGHGADSALINVTAASALSFLGINQGFYIPSLTNSVNISSSSADSCYWTAQGNIVTVFFSVTVTTTAAAASELGIALPSPYVGNIFSVNLLHGSGNSNAAIASNITLEGDVGNNRAKLTFTGLSIGGNGKIKGSFSYLYEAP